MGSKKFCSSSGAGNNFVISPNFSQQQITTKSEISQLFSIIK